MMLRVMTSMLLVAIVASPASAQPNAEPAHNQSISGAAQWALPYPGRDVAPGVQVSWRRWWSPYLGIGTDVRWWQSHNRTEFNSPAQQGPGGAIPSLQGWDDRRVSSFGLGVGILVKGSTGRLSLIGGVGPGLFVDRTSYESRFNERHEARHGTKRSVGVHVLGEVEVRVTHRLSGFAGLRIEQRDVRFVDSTAGYPTAGVRFAF